MKKVLVILLIWSGIGFAEKYTQADRILDMQKLAQAMQDIQSGFFYNNLDIVKAGAKDLKHAIVNVGMTVKEKDTKDIYERWLNNHTAMTMRIQMRIRKYADDIVERFEDGDATQALHIYNRVSAECMKCHTNLRQW